MPNATDIRKGTVLVMGEDLFVCTEFRHSTPGNKRGNVQTKLKNLASGVTIGRKFSSTEKVEFAFLDKRPCEYLYRDGANYVFMDNETYEQHHISADQISDQMLYIVENTVVQVTFFEGTPISLELPGSVELEVTHTEPGVKGDTVSNVYKPATLVTGLEIKVPNHVNIGDVVRVSTQTGDFQGRAG